MHPFNKNNWGAVPVVNLMQPEAWGRGLHSRISLYEVHGIPRSFRFEEGYAQVIHRFH